LYSHDSPYTYFTSDELHLGEISLECSRAGAAAAALWLTFQLLPPRPDGLGQVLAAGRRAALDWSPMLAASGRLRLYQRPELDIVCYFPATTPASLAAIDQASARMLADGMKDPAHPVFLSTLTVDAGAFARRHAGVAGDAGRARILRSVLMKPESESYLEQLHARIEELAG
jgi:glutamate/tyrosine decarboxylase-like PLP-dependent enzyme